MKNLIPKEYLDIIKRKDIKKLKGMIYLAICDTCQMVFRNESFDMIRQEMADGTWDMNKPNQRWYATAGRHWLTMGDHLVRVYVVEGNHRSLVYDLSAVWTVGMARLINAKGEQAAREIMLKELDMIESQALK